MQAMHYTSDTIRTNQSLIACNYARPKPRWNMTYDITKVTCRRCLQIRGAA